MKRKYTCVNCGEEVQELYKKYSSSVLKLMFCKKCFQIADKYVEYDPIITIIDLVLLNKQAYRHIIFNTNFENHWKLAVLLLLMETYSEWINTSSDLLYVPAWYNKSAIEDYHKERRFYFICLIVVTGNIIFILAVYILTVVLKQIQYLLNKPRVDREENFITIWKTITLSSFGRFLHLPAIIWGDSKVAEAHFVFVLGYTILTQLFVHSVIMYSSRRQSTIIILVAYIFKFYFTQLFSSLLISVNF